jgi:hypothetical protein
MAGRKPLELAHVDALDGSERAKQRLRVLLETLHGEFSVAEACQRLGVHESYFHELRHRWLQEALWLLEPQPVGRPRKSPSEESAKAAHLARDNARLAAEAESLREALRAAAVREEIARIKSAPDGGAPAGAGKKTAPRRPL